MNLQDLVDRALAPQPWDEGDNIPWHEPAFSARMLREHLTQAHDAASRRFEKIDQHVAWIQRAVLRERPGRVLDLGCGPGLYSQRLARLGHSCTGIDFSPASIAYAREQAEGDSLNCRYIHDDIRSAEYGTGFDLIMLLYGEFNVFHPREAERILRKARAALRDDGALLLEPHTFEAVRAMGHEPATWSTQTAGLFSDAPYLMLRESLWHDAKRVTTMRYFVVDAATAAVARHAQTFQAYAPDDYRAVLAKCGFARVAFYPSLIGAPDPSQSSLCAIVAHPSASHGHDRA